MTEIQEQAPPRPTTIVPDSCLWVAIWWAQGCNLPMAMYGQDKADVIKWVTQSSSRELDAPIKLYRLDY
jgi:hypothetical protein